MKKLKAILLIVISSLYVISCQSNSERNVEISKDILITEWDNSKYEAYGEMFKYGIGLNVYNSNSYKRQFREEYLYEDLYKETNTLYIDDTNQPIAIKFNNNGKERNFIVTVFYDYEQIPFKISQEGDYDTNFKFDLDAGKEIELPLYLPNDLNREKGVHKLFISFVIGHDINACDLDSMLLWYGCGGIFDVIYDKDNASDVFQEAVEYKDIDKTIDLTYDFIINQDYDYDILNTNILKPMESLIRVKKNNEVKLMYNVSALKVKTENLMILLTLDFNQVKLNNNDYELIKIPIEKTGTGEMNFIAPDKAGKYEVIAYLIYDPFEKNRVDIRDAVSFSQRFTLDVVE